MKRLSSYDLIRIIAIFAVIFIHTSAEFWYEEISNRWYIINFINTFFHGWGVPLFVTLSGSLLLRNKGKELSYSTILKKYMPRILIPLISWHYIYFIFQYKTFNISILLHTTKNLLNGKSYTHLWYLYMLIGLYILTPLINKIIINIKMKELKYYLFFGFSISLIIPFFNLLLPFNITGLLDKIGIIKIETTILYFILGYYLNNLKIKNKKYLYIFSIIALISLVCSCLISNYLTIINNTKFSIASNHNFGGLLFTSAIFLLIKNTIKFENKFINKLGELTFGTYLIHCIILKTLFSLGLFSLNINVFWIILLNGIIVYILSYIFSYIISKIPILRKTIGL